jgi:hypothetical protein
VTSRDGTTSKVIRQDYRHGTRPAQWCRRRRRRRAASRQSRRPKTNQDRHDTTQRSRKKPRSTHKRVLRNSTSTCSARSTSEETLQSRHAQIGHELHRRSSATSASIDAAAFIDVAVAFSLVELQLSALLRTQQTLLSDRHQTRTSLLLARPTAVTSSLDTQQARVLISRSARVLSRAKQTQLFSSSPADWNLFAQLETTRHLSHRRIILFLSLHPSPSPSPSPSLSPSLLSILSQCPLFHLEHSTFITQHTMCSIFHSMASIVSCLPC